MKWEGNRESDNVEDRRGGGGGSPIFGGRSIGIGTIVIALVGGWVLGINPLTILGLLSGGGPPAQVQSQGPAQRPPAGRWQSCGGFTPVADALAQSQAFQAGRSQHDRVVLALVQLAQARVQVAAQRFDAHVVASQRVERVAQQHQPAQAGSANDGAHGQLGQRRAGGRPPC